MGAVFVAIVTAVIVSDTVKYYDHFGVSDRKIAIGLGIGTIAATYVSLMISDLADNGAHFAITIAQVSPPSLRKWIPLMKGIQAGRTCLY